MQKTTPGCFFQQMYSSLTGISMERDHMKDLRRYLALKYIQYLVLSSPNAVSTSLGLLGSLYATIILQSAKVSSKSTAVLISSLAKADILVAISVVLEMVIRAFDVTVASSTAFTPALLQNLLTANTHISCLLLSCVAFEAYLITFFPTESRQLRTVRNARSVSRIIWVLVVTECVLLQTDNLLKASTAAPTRSPYLVLVHFSSMAAALLRSLSYLLGILLRIFNVYIYYKIFFSVSNRSTLKNK